MFDLDVNDIETRPYINGGFFNTASGYSIEKVCPANGKLIAPLVACGKSDVDFAVSVAESAYNNRSWLNVSLKERKRIALRWADMIEANANYLAKLDTVETGRAYRNFLEDSIPKAVEAIRWFAESVDKIHDESYRPNKNELALISREALGVVGVILPWNDPLVVAAWKITPAVLMGNSVVVKPAEQATYSILQMAKLATDAGVHDGVLNVIPGYGDVAGKALALHNSVRGVFFTGSSSVGKKILTYSGDSNMKKVGLECGGKSPFVVTSNYPNLEHAAKVLAKNIFYNQGQICSAPSRLIIDQVVKERFLDYLIEAARTYIPADPFDIDTLVGSVVNREQYERIVGYISRAEDAGMVPIRVGNECGNNKGYYVMPVIFDNVAHDCELVQEEIFGPVLVVQSYKTVTEAVELANDSVYGLAASVWTDDLNEAFYFTRRIEAGTVHVNSYGDDDISVPFGGFKESGIGKDKSLHAMYEYCELKTTWITLSSFGE